MSIGLPELADPLEPGPDFPPPASLLSRPLDDLLPQNLDEVFAHEGEDFWRGDEVSQFVTLTLDGNAQCLANTFEPHPPIDDEFILFCTDELELCGALV